MIRVDGLSVFTLETDNPLKTDYPSGTDNPPIVRLSVKTERCSFWTGNPCIFIRPTIRRRLIGRIKIDRLSVLKGLSVSGMKTAFGVFGVR